MFFKIKYKALIVLHPLTNSLCFAKMEKEEKDRFMKKLNSLLKRFCCRITEKSVKAAGRKDVQGSRLDQSAR